MSKMNPALKSSWVAALRSGDFKQGQYRLKGLGGSYCCLGVLCEIDPEVTYAGAQYDVGWKAVFPGGVESIVDLSMQYMASVGISSYQMSRLTTMNDDCGSSFAQIANYIEANL